MMKPAIFNTTMVRALLARIKTNTRRMVKDQILADLVVTGTDAVAYTEFVQRNSPYQVGDIIYVRETFVVGIPDGTEPESESNPITVFYKADDSVHGWMNEDWDEVNIPWKPSIHMPKEYARLFRRTKDVRIERLNEISYDDALAEGIARDFDEGNEWWLWKNYSTEKFEFEYDFRPEESFGTLWESIYGEGSFDNRYVWVIEFEWISKEEAYATSG